jgi:8-oxo-dGTP pyrophosphatase MutT (NUDIX family)
MTFAAWPAIAVARQRDPARRVPLCWRGEPVGSVAREHLAALAAWPRAVTQRQDGVHWIATDLEPALAAVNAGLRREGYIVGWRDEWFAVVPPHGGERIVRIERAAARFWGTLTLGAHCNGYVADSAARPTRLWIARRSLDKPTDPGLLDNLIGGGVPDGQTPRETVVREGFEEAGLLPPQMAGLRAGRVLRLHRDIAEGLQLEDLHTFDLALPAGWQPQNQDGEVAGFECQPLAEAVRRALGDEMTVDAALVTLDFAVRHHLLGETGLSADEVQAVEQGLAVLVAPNSTVTISESPRQAT